MPGASGSESYPVVPECPSTTMDDGYGEAGALVADDRSADGEGDADAVLAASRVEGADEHEAATVTATSAAADARPARAGQRATTGDCRSGAAPEVKSVSEGGRAGRRARRPGAGSGT
ncbi:hypothetical protein GCM10027446_01780 [Angustibacter peucedani]